MSTTQLRPPERLDPSLTPVPKRAPLVEPRTAATPPSPRTWSLPARWWWIIPAAAVALLGTWIALSSGSRSASTREGEVPTFAAVSGPLTISVTASGSIRNGDAIVLKNKVEGSTQILFLIEEGALVKKGDLLVELDSSELQDKKIDQDIRVQSAEAAWVTAKETLAITHKQGKADIQTAEVDRKLAELDLQKYTGDKPEIDKIIKALGTPDQTIVDALAAIDDAPAHQQQNRTTQASLEKYLADFQAVLDGFKGEYKQDLQTGLNKIRISLAELMRAKDKLRGSIRLASKGYITETEKKADDLDVNKKKSDLQLALGDMSLLMEFTFQRKIEELKNKLNEKTFEVDKATSKAQSNLADAKATLTAKDLTLQREKSKLEKIIAQIEACKIYAPEDGMVVHGTSQGGDFYRLEPLAEGVNVRERQDLIRMPKAGEMVADVKIHESMVEKVREGLPAVVTTNAVPDRRFYGRVKKVAVVPDAQDRWLNPNAKVYNAEIAIEGDTEVLKPGMSCSTEIVVEQHEKATYVPVQAVLRVDDKPTVYVVGDGGQPHARAVEAGLDNNRMIRIVSGLQPGEKVLLNPPLPPASKPMDRPLVPADALASASASAPGAAPRPPAQPAPTPPPGAPQGTAHSPAPPSDAGAAKPGGNAVAAAGAQRGFGNATPEQQAQMRERFLAMIPEEYREKVKAMSSEQQRAWFQSDEGRKVMQQLRSQFGGAGAGGFGRGGGAAGGAGGPGGGLRSGGPAPSR